MISQNKWNNLEVVYFLRITTAVWYIHTSQERILEQGKEFLNPEINIPRKFEGIIQSDICANERCI